MQTLIAQYKIFGKKPSFEEKKNLIKIGCLKKIKTGSFGFFKFRVFLPNPAPHTKYDLDGKSVLTKMSIFYWKNEVVSHPPKVCQVWHIWAPNLTYKSPLRNWKKIWPSWKICASKNELLSKSGLFIEKMVVFPPRTTKVCRVWLIWAPNLTYKFPLRNKKIWPSWEICASKNEFLSKNGHFYWKKVSSEKLGIKMTLVGNLCLKKVGNLCLNKWILVQKWQFLLKKWGGFTAPGPPRFAGHGTCGPQILPTSLLCETEKKYDLCGESVPQKMSFCLKMAIFIEKMKFYSPRTLKDCRTWLIWAPKSKSYHQVSSEKLKKNHPHMTLEANV